MYVITLKRLPTDKRSDANFKALVDGPSKRENGAVPRHSAAMNNFIITPLVIAKLPRGAGRGAVARAWEKNEVEKKWDQSAWAKRREQREKRRNLSDFDRFKVLRLKKQACPPCRNVYGCPLAFEDGGPSHAVGLVAKIG